MNRSENNHLSSVGNEFVDNQCVRCGTEKARDLRAEFWSGLVRNTVRFLTQSAGWISSGIAALRRAREYRRAVRELRAMPNSMLKDLGIGRCEIDGLVYGYSERRSSIVDLPVHKPIHKPNDTAKQPDQVCNSVHFDNAA